MRDGTRNMSAIARPASAGFTLIELIITVVIAGIIASIAIPAMGDYMASGKMTTATNAVVTELVYTKSEAVKRSTPVTFCASKDLASCSGDWSLGWIVFVDVDADAVVDGGDGDEILRRSDAPLQGMAVKSARADITFQPRGTTFSTNTLTLCSKNKNVENRAIILSQVGRHRLAKSANDPKACT